MVAADSSKPSMFVGSSTEGIDFARAVRALLAQDVEVTLWNEGFFRPGDTFIDSLVNALPRFDFATLILTSDDLITSRDAERLGPRDNVIFELGLFMGRIGRARTFLVHSARSAVKIPSDLAGVTAATYDWPRQDGNHQAALGSACDSIRTVVRDLGIIEAKAGKAIRSISNRQKQQEEQLSLQQAEIRSLQMAMQGIVTRYEWEKLVGLEREGPFPCYYSEDLHNELKRLRAMGFVLNHEGTGLTAMRQRYKDRNEQFDLKRFVYITDQGREYLELRDELMAEDD